MMRTLRNLLLFVVLVLVLVLGGLVYYLVNNQDEIEERLLSELNKGMETEVIVNGDLDLSIFSHFPDISLKANDIIIMGSTGMPTDTLIQAKELYLVTDLFDLLAQNWSIKKVEIAHGAMHMKRSASGQVNYRFVKSEKDPNEPEKQSSFFLNIIAADLEDIRFTFVDEQSKVDLDLEVYSAVFSGNFSPEALALDTDIKLFSHKLTIKEINYFSEKEMSAEGELSIATDSSLYVIHTDEVYIADNHFGVNGSFSLLDDRTHFDLAINGIDLSLLEFMGLFPEKVMEQFTDYQISGDLQFNTTIKGDLSKKKNPTVTVDYELTNSQLVYTELDSKIDKLDIIGSFTNGNKQNLSSSIIKLTKLRAEYAGKAFQAAGVMNDLDHPFLNIEAFGDVNLPMLWPLVPDSSGVDALEGWVHINSTSYKGPLSDLTLLTTPKPIDLRFAGDFENTSVTIDGIPLTLTSGSVDLSPWTIKTNALGISYDGMKLSLTGTLQHWKSYVYNLLAEDHVDAKAMNVDMTVKGSYVKTSSSEETNATVNEPTGSTSLPLAADLFNTIGTLRLDLSEVTYDELQIKGIKTDLKLTPGKMQFTDLNLNAFKGTARTSGTISAAANSIALDMTGKVEQMDISSIFKGLGEPGAPDLTSVNIKGTLKATYTLKAQFNDYKLNENSLYFLSDLSLLDGEMVNVKALEELARFVDIDDLRHIRFSDLHNQIEIKNRTIHIPQMIIKSNAMNLSVSGTHTFDNYLDYRLKLNIYDVVGKKFLGRKKKNEQFYEVVDDNSFNFFIAMKGPIDNLDISYDKKGVKERFQQQKDELNKAINGLYDDYNAEKEKRDWEVPAEDEFIDWD